MTVLVGHPPRADGSGRAPLAYGALLARSAGLPLRAVAVVPAPWPTPLPGGTDREHAAWARELGEAVVADARATLAEVAPDLETEAVAVPGRSVPQQLLAEAERVGASVVAVGSGDDGAWGRVVLGSAADRLLHSAPLPVALAPRGYTGAADARVRRVTCAFRGDRASEAALERAARMCVRIGAALRVVTFGVEGRTMFPPEVRGEADVLAAFVEQAGTAQAAALRRLAGSLPDDVTSRTATGRDWTHALGSLPWDDGDVLVVGSSPAGLVSRVFLGSSATKIVRSSPVPVVVVP
ncbi:universal stress protein [Nocardioides sp. ChNu-153]|uniref:universal stress protein n=1 Tax=Nocardioides sp. ChNu-153 TaxID=2779364 RepID=UPI0026501ADB|nr:universal stress protein [Nocardioides sp. ChNu-153]MDN7120946.1 universal stress protein [Nocardioides sp. ChNu-153]